MFAELTFWDCITNFWVLPWGKLFLPLSAFSVACTSLCRVDTFCGLSLVWFSMSISVVIVKLIFRQFHSWDFICVNSEIPRKHNFITNSPFHLALIIFLPPLLHGSLSPEVRALMLTSHLGLRMPMLFLGMLTQTQFPADWTCLFRPSRTTVRCSGTKV